MKDKMFTFRVEKKLAADFAKAIKKHNNRWEIKLAVKNGVLNAASTQSGLLRVAMEDFINFRRII